MSFSDFNLQEEFIASIHAAGYQSPTKLQSELIPIISDRKSAIVWTQSASGKTGAFIIPAMNYILENPDPDKRGARILVLTSRRDRVSQINYTIKCLSNNHIMRFGFIVSGRPYQTQMRLMRRPLDIMIATPGRLNDLMNNGKADFSGLEMLIIDDFTSIYQKKLHGLVEKIIDQTNEDCLSLTFVRDDEEVTPFVQKLFPDATPVYIEEEDQEQEKPKHEAKPTKKNNKNPKQKQSAKPKIIKLDIPQKVHISDDYTHKIAMMDHLLDEFAGESTIIYTATNKAAKTLQENLANHGHAAEILDDIGESEVDDCDIVIISDQGKIKVTSDLLENNDQHIINFDLPRRTDRYIQRLKNHSESREEAVLLMIDGYNYNELKHLEKTIDSKLDQITVPGLEPLKPFVNLSKGRKPANKQSNNRQKTNNRNKNTRNRNSKSRNQNNNQNKNPNSRSNNNSSNNTNSRRQRKGPFGRLNGGANRKKGGATIGLSRRGTDAPSGDRGWQSDFAEPQERKTEAKTVTIRYSKKRTIVNKPDET